MKEEVDRTSTNNSNRLKTRHLHIKREL